MQKTLQDYDGKTEVMNEKPYVIQITQLPAKVDTKVRMTEKYMLSVIIVGLALMGIYSLSTILFGLSAITASIFGIAIVMFFIAVLFFLIQPKISTTVEKTIVRDIAYPSVKQTTKPVIVYVDKPIEIVKTIEKPIVKEKIVEKPVEITRFVERPVIQYVPKQNIALKIAKFKYIGSTQTKKYHKKTCRLGKLIKKKYKLNSNSLTTFKRKKFKRCKNCFKA